MKNLLTQWETEDEIQKTGANIPLINKKHNGKVLLIDDEHNDNMLLIGSKHSGNMLLIDKKFAKLKYDAECASLPKFTKLVKKSSNLTRTRKEKLHHPISNSLAHFVEPAGRPCFHFVEGLAGLTDGLAIDGVELREEKVAVGFSG